MSREKTKCRSYRSTVASCGAVATLVCSLLGIGSVESGSYIATRLFGQQQTNQSVPQDQIVFFSLPVGVETAPIFASPSKETYQTGVVARGEEVEIYFRNDDGFCAIRPPQGSFSWVNGKFIQVEPDSYGRVVSPSSKSIPSRVGAEVPETSSVAQIGLKPDQRVKILEKTQRQDGVVWYKIAPPPGEFRWIHESSLVRTSALTQLPSKLTTRSEYLQGLNATPRPRNEDGEQERSVAAADSAPFSSGDIRPDVLPQSAARQTPRPIPPAYGGEAFDQEITRLNADVFQILQKEKPTDAELSRLQARAEALFDAAPDDEKRGLVQTTFDAITKAQIAMQHASVNTLDKVQIPSVANQIVGATPNSMPFISGTPFDSSSYVDQNGQVVDASFLDGQNFDGLQIVDGQIVGTPTMIDGAYVLGATIVDDGVGAPKDEKESKPKSRLGFAFSRSNNPFQKSSRDSDAPKPKSTVSRMESSLAHLPGLQPDQTTTIVPPQNYNFAKRVAPSKSIVSAKLAPGPLRSELARHNTPISTSSQSVAAQPTQTRQGALVFQSPQFDASRSPVNTNSSELVAMQDAASNWSSVASDLDARRPSTTLPASFEESKGTNAGVRQTSAFTPATSKSFDNFDASGVLVELSGVADGAPRYALLDSSGDSFDVVAYLDPDKNVSLDRFVGQKVVVKGASGTVTINNNSRKHIVVSSLFLLK